MSQNIIASLNDDLELDDKRYGIDIILNKEIIENEYYHTYDEAIARIMYIEYLNTNDLNKIGSYEYGKFLELIDLAEHWEDASSIHIVDLEGIDNCWADIKQFEIINDEIYLNVEYDDKTYTLLYEDIKNFEIQECYIADYDDWMFD